MKNIKPYLLLKNNTHPFGAVAILQPQANSNTKIKTLVGKLGFWLKTVIRRGINDAKVIEDTYARKFKR